MSLSNVYEAKMLDHMFGLAALTAPTLWIGLSTADPGEDGAGLAEPTGGAYARVTVTAWTRTVSSVANTNQFQFLEATAAWGICTYLVAFDAATAGDIVFSFVMDAPLDVASGDQVTFHAGNCAVTMD